MIDPQAFDDDDIVEPSSLVSTHTFRLKGISYPKITVRIWKDTEAHGGNHFYRYEISHAIHAPGQAGPYYPSAPFGDSEQATLERAIRDFTSYYASAKEQGHSPDPSWVVPIDRTEE